MYIWKLEARKLVRYESLSRALQNDMQGLKKRPCILSFVGAGGKTTHLYELGNELQKEGLRVLVTTTTHMMQPKERFLQMDQNGALPGSAAWENIGLAEYESGIWTVGSPCGNGKITGNPYRVLEEYGTWLDVLLIEADGSRRCPVKVPASHEPVVIEETSMTIGVQGCQAIGRPIIEAAYRPEEFARFAGKSVYDTISFADLWKAAVEEQGILKDAKGKKAVLFNRCSSKLMKEIEAFLEGIKTMPEFAILLAEEYEKGIEGNQWEISHSMKR